jgi:Rrf2 family protein
LAGRLLSKAMLSQKARYALHVMLFLVKREGSATADEIAQSERIPRKFLEHVMAALKQRGIVVGKRGPAGGYVLGRAPDKISIAEILRCIDGPLALAPCASLSAYRPCPDCQSVETCQIRPILLAVRDTTALLLEGTSLAAAARGESLSFL